MINLVEVKESSLHGKGVFATRNIAKGEVIVKSDMALVHVNDVKAKVDKRIILVSIVIALVVGVILLFFLGAIWLFMLLLPMVFWAQQEQAVSAFNRYKIKR